jgi:CubicO group peptidase (beta-lactamase class C family)
MICRVGVWPSAQAGKATEATLFRIGSTSNAFVALTAMALVREGKLSLDTPLAKALPGFWFRNAWEATDPVRIVNLLEHTSGFDDNSLQSYANSDPKPLTLSEGLAIDTATRVSRWRPGTHFSYCNTGPAIVALAGLYNLHRERVRRAAER